jgi:ketosteroid isomerase-like protein
MLADKPRLSIEVPKVVESGDVALLCSKWSSTVTGGDGRERTDTGNGREVVRRQADGTWRFVITIRMVATDSNSEDEVSVDG